MAMAYTILTERHIITIGFFHKIDNSVTVNKKRPCYIFMPLIQAAEVFRFQLVCLSVHACVWTAPRWKHSSTSMPLNSSSLIFGNWKLFYWMYSHCGREKAINLLNRTFASISNNRVQFDQVLLNQWRNVRTAGQDAFWISAQQSS